MEKRAGNKRGKQRTKRMKRMKRKKRTLDCRQRAEERDRCVERLAPLEKVRQF